MNAFVYIPKCSDGSYYVGSARGQGLDKRIGEHQSGKYPGHTHHRGLVELLYADWFDGITDAIAAEQQIKRWSRAKKEALIAADWERLQLLAKRPSPQTAQPNPTTSR